MDKLIEKILKEIEFIESTLPEYGDIDYKAHPDNLRCDVDFSKTRLKKLVIELRELVSARVKNQNERVPFGQRK